MLFSQQQKQLILLSSLGGALEFYDFVIFGFLAKIISRLFFPAYDALASLLPTFAIFAIGYLIRPLGGIVFGHFGDRYGRKTTFLFSVFLMAIPTVLIALLPTYAHIGITASLLLIVLRLLQGLSVGGELPGAIIYIAETAPIAHRGLACGLIFFGINLGLLLGSLIGTGLANLLSEPQLYSWGWRVPFLLGGLLCIVSYQLRKKMIETPCFMAMSHHERLPIKTLFMQHRWLIVQGIAMTWIGAATFSCFFLFLPTFLTTQLQIPLQQAWLLNTLNISIFALQVVCMCYLADVIGRKKIMLLATLFFILFAYPLFWLLQQNSLPLIILTGILAALATGCITGSFACMLAEIFPTKVRYSGFALVYNIGFAYFGGLTPLIATLLIKTTQNNAAPSYYIIGSGIISLLALLTLPETKHRNLA